jgi:aspartyl-tRNA(Asn)/glutamyl-tRNA(Gln) amidotransferase subunit A
MLMAGPTVGSLHTVLKEHYQSFLTTKVAESLKGCKIAWSPTLGNTEVDREVLQLTEAAVKIFANFGCELEETRPSFDSVEIPYITIFYSGLACRFGEYVERFRKKMDSSLLYAIEKGSQYGAMNLQNAIYMRTKLFQIMRRFFEKFDLLITPTLSAPALPNQNALSGMTTEKG